MAYARLSGNSTTPKKVRDTQWAWKSERLARTGLVLAICTLASIATSAQTFTTLHSFNGADGQAPNDIFLVQGFDGKLYGTTEAGGAYHAGTVFKITTAGTFTSIYSFCPPAACDDGSSPFAGLVLATNGYFYGTTEFGGTANDGTVYKISPGGVLTTLLSLDGTDGSRPLAGLIQATNNDFYGTTFGDDSSSVGTIFAMTPSGTPTLLHTFNGTDGSLPYGRLVQGTNGIFYGTTYEEGPLTQGTVYAITAAGKLKTLHSFAEQGADGANPVGPLFQATDGNFYGGTTAGGAHNDGTVFEMTPAGTLTSIYSFCALPSCADGFAPQQGVIQATDGNLYGTTLEGGAHNGGTIFRITTAGVVTTLYDFCSKASCADGYSPTSGLLQATDGNLYGATCDCFGSFGHGTVFQLSLGLAPFVRALPAQGRISAKIVLLGTSLNGTTAVSFNGTPATFTTVSKTAIITTVPAGATTGSITVTTPGGVLTSDRKFLVGP